MRSRLLIFLAVPPLLLAVSMAVAPPVMPPGPTWRGFAHVPSSAEAWIWDHDPTGLALGALRRADKHRLWFLGAAAFCAAAWRPDRRRKNSSFSGLSGPKRTL